jgi:multiple sugar transport system permease protein
MFANYLNGIPNDEAGRVDGCSILAILFKVIVPAAMPGIVAVWVYSFMQAWGEILFACQLTDNDTATLASDCRTMPPKPMCTGIKSWQHR